MSFQEAKLQNGLTIVAERNHSAAAAAMGFFVRTGGRDESEAVWGVSHFLEHMLFKGTEARSAHEFNRAFDGIGASYNAATSMEKTVYYGEVLPEYERSLLGLLADLMGPALRQDDFDMEKQVILDEIAVYEDQPIWRAYEQLMVSYFRSHPLGHSVLGTIESVTNMTRDEMAGYFAQRYVPGNIIVCGSGNLDFEAFVEQVAEACGEWEGSAETLDVPPAPDLRTMEVMTDDRIQRQHVAIMSPAPAEQDDQRHAADLAASILGDVTHSRLYYALIEPAIADDAQIIYEGLDRVGAMFTYVSCDPSRARQALDLVRGEAAQFQAEGPTEAEVTAAKNKLATGLTISAESPMRRLMGLGNDWFYRHRYRSVDDDVEDILAVTRDEVHDVIRQWDYSAMTVVTLGPLDSL